MSINPKENKTDGFVEDILSFDELEELEDLEESQVQRKLTNTQDQSLTANLEEGELSDFVEETPAAQKQPEYVDSDHSDEEIMKEIQAKVKLSKKRRRQKPFQFVAAPALMTYNLAMPFPYQIPAIPGAHMWPNGFYPPPVQPKRKNQQPVDLSLLDSDSDEFKETSNKNSATTTQPVDSSEKEEGSLDPESLMKRPSKEKSRSSDRDRDRKREHSPERKKEKRHKDKKSKERHEKRHKKERNRHKEHRHRDE